MGRVIVVVVVGAAVAAGAFLLAARGSDEPPAADTVALGEVGDFPPDSVRRLELEAAYFDAAPLDGDPDGAGVGETASIPVFVVNRPPDGIVALLGRSPFLGCRVVRVTRSEALEFSASLVPDDFTGGFLDPCHGGLFGTGGRLFGGPGDRGLDRFLISEAPDGVLTVDLTLLQLGPTR